MEYLTVQERIEMILVSIFHIKFVPLFQLNVKQFAIEVNVQRKKHTHCAPIAGENNQITILCTATVNPHISTRLWTVNV